MVSRKNDSHENTKMTETTYSSGICNIGDKEVAQRKRIGYIGIVLTVVGFLVYTIGIYTIKLEPIVGIGLFIPALMGSVGLIQARNKFCAAYGFGKKYNISSGLGVILNVEDAVNQERDRNKAIRIVIQSVLISVAISLISVSLGVLMSV